MEGRHCSIGLSARVAADSEAEPGFDTRHVHMGTHAESVLLPC